MIRALYSAASGMTAQQTQRRQHRQQPGQRQHRGLQDRAARSSRICCTRTWCSRARPPASRPPCPPACNSAWARAPRPTRSSSRRATFTQTGNPLDLVIQGNGFFQIQLPTASWPTRAPASSSSNKDGNMVTPNGNLLSPQITIPPNAQSITIATDGTVSYTLPGQTAAQKAGQIQLANFQQSGRLEQPRPESVSAHRCFGRRRLSAIPAARKAWARCCRATPSNPTSAWWRSSSI